MACIFPLLPPTESYCLDFLMFISKLEPMAQGACRSEPASAVVLGTRCTRLKVFFFLGLLQVFSLVFSI